MTTYDKSLIAGITARLKFLSTGDLLRVEVRVDTPLEQAERERAAKPTKGDIVQIGSVNAKKAASGAGTPKAAKEY